MGNILIVEDDANIRKLVTVNLEKRGYKLSEAGDGNQAMLLFRQYPFDLVLLDLVLPGLFGVDVCTWIRSRFDSPIIVLSGLKDEEDVYFLMVCKFELFGEAGGLGGGTYSDYRSLDLTDS